MAGDAGAAAVVPLGHCQPTRTTYRLIKPSAFVFRTARQRDRVLAEWRRLVGETHCGPELLALRRTFGGSLTAVAGKLHELIRGGAERLNGLNLHKLWGAGTVGRLHGTSIREGREAAGADFTATLAADVTKACPLTGLVVDRRSLAAVRAATASVRW